MDVIKGVRLLAASLLVLSGIIHLALAAFTAGIEMAVTALFGLLFVAIGIGLFVGKRLFNYLGVVVPLIGMSLGVYSYVAMKRGSISILLPCAAMNTIAILCCCYLILHKKPS